MQRLSLEVMTLNPMCEGVETAQGVPLTVTGVAQCKIMKVGPFGSYRANDETRLHRHVAPHILNARFILVQYMLVMTLNLLRINRKRNRKQKMKTR